MPTINVLVLQSDQERPDLCGLCGGPARAPALQRLAAQGVLFDCAFTPIPICAPARAALITGLRPGRHELLFNKESGSVAGRDFTARPATLAELLAPRGYRPGFRVQAHAGGAGWGGRPFGGSSGAARRGARGEGATPLPPDRAGVRAGQAGIADAQRLTPGRPAPAAPGGTSRLVGIGSNAMTPGLATR